MRNARVIGWCAAAWVAVTATSCGGKKPLPVIDPLSNVSAHWQLDEQQSDNSAGKIAGAMPDGDRTSGPEGQAAGRGRGGDASGGARGRRPRRRGMASAGAGQSAARQ